MVDDIEASVKRAIRKAIGGDADTSIISDDTPIFNAGIGYDSIILMSLVVALEEEFGMNIPDEEFEVGIFESVKTISEYFAGGAASCARTHDKAEATHDNAGGATSCVRTHDKTEGNSR